MKHLLKIIAILIWLIIALILIFYDMLWNFRIPSKQILKKYFEIEIKNIRYK